MLCTWGRPAILALLCSVRGNPALQLMMAPVTNHDAWDAIATTMVARGHPMSCVKLRAWWKTEKAAFHWEKNHCAWNACPSQGPPATYRQMCQFWLYCDQHYEGMECHHNIRALSRVPCVTEPCQGAEPRNGAVPYPGAKPRHSTAHHHGTAVVSRLFMALLCSSTLPR